MNQQACCSAVPSLATMADMFVWVHHPERRIGAVLPRDPETVQLRRPQRGQVLGRVLALGLVALDLATDRPRPVLDICRGRIHLDPPGPAGAGQSP